MSIDKLACGSLVSLAQLISVLYCGDIRTLVPLSPQKYISGTKAPVLILAHYLGKKFVNCVGYGIAFLNR